MKIKEDIVFATILKMGKWASIRKELEQLIVDNFFKNWKACLKSGRCQTKPSVKWPSSSQNVLKLNVDDVARGESILPSVGSVLTI